MDKVKWWDKKRDQFVMLSCPKVVTLRMSRHAFNMAVVNSLETAPTPSFACSESYTCTKMCKIQFQMLRSYLMDCCVEKLYFGHHLNYHD